MKNVVRSLTFAALLVSTWVPAWAEDLSSVETEIVESTLEKAQVAQQDKLLIKVGKGEQIYEFETTPDREMMKESLGLKIPDKVREQIIARGGSVAETDPLEPFESLPEDRRKKFHEMRLMFLTNAARILNSTKFVYGAGSLVGDGLSFVKIKVKKAFGKETVVESQTQRTFQVRSQQAVQSILRGLDYKLWSQAPLVIDSNEFGLSVSAGILAEAGVLRKGGGGADEVGFSIAFNKTKKAFVFEIFHNSEKFDNTKAAITVIGVVGKAGITMGRRDGAETLKGTSFYPPAIPGYSTSSPEFFSSGLSSSLGFPPPPLADLLTFTNRFERQALIRITVSPLVKGFVRVQIGDVKGSVRLVAMRFVDVYTAISDKVHLGGRRACGPVFN
ncbi:hypothetical protein ACNQKP_16575 [Bdellovibrio bacteriovorus]|uniref:hypothetical protein n=1 Tax=Bdellovibrio bacteriovorus TaxID=959 RepID=UPI003AA85652